MPQLCRRHRLAALAVGVFFGTIVPVCAQDPLPIQLQRREVTATRTSEPPVIDGLLNDECWSLAEPASDFTQRDPDEGMPPTERTEIRILYDDDALYVAARLFDSQPTMVGRRLSNRDADADADRVTIYLDSMHDRLTGAAFGVSASNVQKDTILFNDTFQESSWDAVWHSEVTIDEAGWSAEIRIPLSQLRFPPADRHTWGINVERFIQRKNETVWLEMVPKDAAGLVSRMIDLIGLDGLRPRRHVELLPYTAARAEFIAPDEGDPFNDGARAIASAGLDVKWSVTSNLILDGTINPDFGQVEVDPAVVNLTAFETFFPEKRAFFMEGAQIFSNYGQGGSNSFWGFNTSDPNIFYSRRIGRTPQIDPDGDFVDSPTATTILGAAKLTGKTSGGWSVGFLERSPIGKRRASRRAIRGGPTSSRSPTTRSRACSASWAARRRSASWPPRSSAGSTRPRCRERPRRSGVRLRHRCRTCFSIAVETGSSTGKIAGSHVSGTATADRGAAARAAAVPPAARRAARHAWTRPHDPRRLGRPQSISIATAACGRSTPRSGASARASNRTTSDSTDLGPRRSARRLVVARRHPESHQPFAQCLGGEGVDVELRPRAAARRLACARSMTFLNYWNVNGGGLVWRRALDDRLTRGGPSTVSPGGSSWSINGETDARNWLSLRASIEKSGNDAGDSSDEVRLTRVLSHHQNGVLYRAGMDAIPNRRAVPASVDDPSALATFGQRHVFGTIVDTALDDDEIQRHCHAQGVDAAVRAAASSPPATIRTSRSSPALAHSTSSSTGATQAG